MKRFLFVFCLLALAGVPLLNAADRGDEVVVIYNTRVPESRDVAQHYAEMRHVPAGQVLGFDLPSDETMTRAEYHYRLEKPLLKILEDRDLLHFGVQVIPTTNGTPRLLEKTTGAKIRYLVLCYGIPLRIAQDSNLREENAEKLPPEFRANAAAVDSELACLPIPAGKMLLAGPMPNSFYGCTNATLFDPTNGILVVARLDGPTAAIASALVDKAIQAETDGLWGRAYFDLRGISDGEYKIGDDWIRAASETCRVQGFETVVDYGSATFPANFPLSQVAFYAGWYNPNASGPFARPTVEFMPGAFAYHLHSFSALTLRSTTRGWAGPLLAKGATATMGCVAEPLLIGTPDMAVFFDRLIASGFTFGEAAYASQRWLSWQTTVVGDPLYCPFAKTPQQQHDELARRHSPLIEWSWLRLLDFELAHGASIPQVIGVLENIPATRQSPVLMEKLADLYSIEDNPSNSVTTLECALNLNPTPQQRIRLTLTLANRLFALQRMQEAYDVYQQFLKNTPDYPDPLFIYRRLADIAQKLGKTFDAQKYEHLVSRLSLPAVKIPRGSSFTRGM